MTTKHYVPGMCFSCFWKENPPFFDVYEKQVEIIASVPVWKQQMQSSLIRIHGWVMLVPCAYLYGLVCAYSYRWYVVLSFLFQNEKNPCFKSTVFSTLNMSVSFIFFLIPNDSFCLYKMTKCHHIISKYHRTMSKYHHIMSKYPRIMLKDHHIIKVFNIRQLRRSI